MPPLAVAGRTFLFSWDDLTFPALIAVCVHVAWLLFDTSNEAEYVFRRRSLDTRLLSLDAGLCSATIVADLSIGVLAQQCKIMERPRHEKLLKCIVALRLMMSTALFAIYAFAAGCIATHKVRKHYHIDVQYGFGEVDHRRWVVWIFDVLVCLRLVIVIPGACFLCAMLVPKDHYGNIGREAVKRALQFSGVSSEVAVELIGVLMVVLGSGTSDLVVPSDLMFGLVLVAARQLQGAIYSDEYLDSSPQALPTSEIRDLERSRVSSNEIAKRSASSTMPPSAVRASMVCGVNKPPVPLSEGNKHDMTSLWEITHYVTFAIAIYGVSMEFFASNVYTHTSVISPWALCSWFRRWCRCCCCRRNTGGPWTDRVYGDFRGWNQEAFQNLLTQRSELNLEERAELLWATWENRGPATAPPFAVVLDRQAKSLVVCVRGTMDVKDCLSDLGAEPAFFDPLGLASEESQRQQPFDDRRDYFAHSTMIKVAEDVLRRLDEAGVLEDALGASGPAHGWNIVVTGHSLGAGVATLVALMLRGTGREYSERVRAVVFEPPGGLMCERLSELTSHLGFLVGVCSHDWIPRLSIRGLQELRERMLDELDACDRSKWQLVMLVWARLARKAGTVPVLKYLFCGCLWSRPLSKFLMHLGGGPLTTPSGEPAYRQPCASHGEAQPTINGRGSASSIRRLAKEASMCAGRSGRSYTVQFFNELWPPANIIYFRPTSLEWWCCDLYQVGHGWVAEWVQPQDLHELIVSTRSIELHFPNILRDAFLSAAVHLGAISDGCSSWASLSPRSSSGSGEESSEAEDEAGETCSLQQHS